ncbi:MAG: TetR family transcriptional regulator, partial [Candidatus Dormibacteraeota bacterium]|nr:TetR family transcriptional regulator [Candidatus Dormibacteraeota bacterium]
LFAGSDQLQQAIVDAMAEAPASARPIDAVGIGLAAAERFFNSDNRDFSRLRHRIITANAELLERELIKLASLASAIAGALRRRGVPDPAASLTAEAGMGVFRVAFEAWIADDENWPDLVNRSLAQLKELVAAR